MGGNNTRGRVRICKSHYNTYVLTMYGYNENKKGDNNSRYFVAFFPIHLSSEHIAAAETRSPLLLYYITLFYNFTRTTSRLPTFLHATPPPLAATIAIHKGSVCYDLQSPPSFATIF